MTSQVAWGQVPQFDESDRLRKALQVAGMTQEDMSDYLGVSRGTVRNWLNGHTTIKRAARIAWALRTGVPVVWLETGTAPVDDDGGRVVSHNATRHAVEVDRAGASFGQYSTP